MMAGWVPEPALTWVLAKAREKPLWSPGRLPRPAYSYREIAENFNRSVISEKFSLKLDFRQVGRIVRESGDPEARAARRMGGYASLKNCLPR